VYEGITQSLALGEQNNQSASGFSTLARTAANFAKMDGTMRLYNPYNSTAHKLITFDEFNDDASVGTNFQKFDEPYNQTAAVNAIKVKATSGNLTSGTVTCQPLAQ
jgi:hypothetical protein